MEQTQRTTTPVPRIEATQVVVPPNWALWERKLIDVMNRAAVAYVERYTRPDGTLIWRDVWPGMDGSDDAYESFYTFPLFYLLGGGEEVYRLARKEWEAITWQWTEYGQLYREFDAYYDWMHHGESNLFLYFLALCDPSDLKDRQRAARFAAFYTGEDPEAPNYDVERKMMRSPINGSRGPRLEISREDWSTHRDVLRQFPKPFEDIPGVTGEQANFNDDETFTHILALMNQRMAKGDVPLNLLATTQLAHAYLYTGEERYKTWILDYLAAWEERARANGGLIPDNIGPNGIIGECMDGKWWGGYYGYRWPRGIAVILEAVVVAGMNATLLTGDTKYLDLARAQLDMQWSRRREEEGEWRVPHKHHDCGWVEYQPMSPALPLQLWYLSHAEEDLERVLRIPDHGRWDRELTVNGNGWAPGIAWFRYLQGHAPDYPETILRATYREVARILEAIRNDREDPDVIYIQHWIAMNPVLCDALLQLTLGAPYPVYHGGLLHAQTLYFDPETRRPGLPEDTAALIEAVDQKGFRLQLVNLDPQSPRRVIIQAGAFGEHQFTAIKVVDSEDRQDLDSRWFEVALGPGAGVTLNVECRRHVNTPRYQTPWSAQEPPVRLIKNRTPDIDPGAVRFWPDEGW